LKLNEAQKIGKKLARYFVHTCGEGEHYVPLIKRLRESNTRSSFLEAIYTLIYYGEIHLDQNLEDVNEQEIEQLSQFIRTGNCKEVSLFHSSLSLFIWDIEIKNIHQQERYLLKLLS
jgi:hypothetical protein